LLIEVFNHGTAHPARRSLPPRLVVAGKTGTSNDYRDSWFAGFLGGHLIVVWMGHDDNCADRAHRHDRRAAGVDAAHGVDQHEFVRAGAARRHRGPHDRLLHGLETFLLLATASTCPSRCGTVLPPDPVCPPGTNEQTAAAIMQMRQELQREAAKRRRHSVLPTRP
jgi:membrane peptidoglycan carboxypeptidase